MKKTVKQLADFAASTYTNENDPVITGISIDSRTVKPGNLYVPILGARADGHTFIESVKQAKAAATLWQRDHDLPEDIPVILVDDTVKALGKMASAYLKELDPVTIGITGSNGKTSAKDMMKAVFATRYNTEATPGNRNSEIGLPLTILDFPEDVQTAILEMGMENKGEIRTLVNLAPLNAAVITSIGSAHMENLGSRKGIAQAKLEILEGLKTGGVLLYHKDSPEIEEVLHEMDIRPDIRLVSFGTSENADICAEDIQTVHGHMEFTVGTTRYKLNALGQFQCINALPAIWLARHAGIPETDIHAALENLHMTGMRTQLKPAGNARILDDSYKSNPESAKAALDTLAALPGRKLAILADMLDLGPEEIQLHQDVLGHAAGLGIEVWTTGDIYEKIAHNWSKTQDELYEKALPLLDEEVTILVKGSRALQMDKLADRLVEKGNEMYE